MSALTKLLDRRPRLAVLIRCRPLTLHRGRTRPASAEQHKSHTCLERPNVSSHPVH